MHRSQLRPLHFEGAPGETGGFSSMILQVIQSTNLNSCLNNSSSEIIVNISGKTGSIVMLV
jgi:hypothetical protein